MTHICSKGTENTKYLSIDRKADVKKNPAIKFENQDIGTSGKIL